MQVFIRFITEYYIIFTIFFDCKALLYKDFTQKSLYKYQFQKQLLGQYFFFEAQRKSTQKENLFLRFAIAALGGPSQLFSNKKRYDGSKHLEFGSCLWGFQQELNFELLARYVAIHAEILSALEIFTVALAIKKIVFQLCFQFKCLSEASF